MTELNIHGQHQLPPIPNHIRKLDCSYNFIKSIPDLINITNLDCDSNKICKLSNLPQVKKLSCSYNKIKYLPLMPKLVDIDCRDNKIRSINKLTKMQKYVLLIIVLKIFQI